jgi:hypothetical protein
MSQVCSGKVGLNDCSLAGMPGASPRDDRRLAQLPEAAIAAHPFSQRGSAVCRRATSASASEASAPREAMRSRRVASGAFRKSPVKATPTSAAAPVAALRSAAVAKVASSRTACPAQSAIRALSNNLW